MFAKKMSRKHQFNNDMEFMKEMMSKGSATESTEVAENGKCWYLPCHGSITETNLASSA